MIRSLLTLAERVLGLATPIPPQYRGDIVDEFMEMAKQLDADEVGEWCHQTLESYGVAVLDAVDGFRQRAEARGYTEEEARKMAARFSAILLTNLEANMKRVAKVVEEERKA